MRGSHRQQIFRRSGAKTPNIQIVPTLGSKVYREYLGSPPSESQTPELRNILQTDIELPILIRGFRDTPEIRGLWSWDLMNQQ